MRGHSTLPLKAFPADPKGEAGGGKRGAGDGSAPWQSAASGHNSRLLS